MLWKSANLSCAKVIKLIILQIGDRKMDSGALELGETLDEDFDMGKDTLPQELIWLMDEMLNREVCPSAKQVPCCSRL